jgi:hypothetical protein
MHRHGVRGYPLIHNCGMACVSVVSAKLGPSRNRTTPGGSANYRTPGASPPATDR